MHLILVAYTNCMVYLRGYVASYVAKYLGDLTVKNVDAPSGQIICSSLTRGLNVASPSVISLFVTLHNSAVLLQTLK